MIDIVFVRLGFSIHGDVVYDGRRNLQKAAPMHALTILQRHLAPLLAGIHARRLATLLDAGAATVCGPRLTLTDVGRRFGGEATPRKGIKRADRLLGNKQLQGQARIIYRALAQKLLRGVSEPPIVIDWSDLTANQSLHLLRASLPVCGRSRTLSEVVHPQGKPGQSPGAAPLTATLGTTVAGLGPAHHRRRFRLQGAALLRGRAAGLALGRAGARARFRQAQALAIPLRRRPLRTTWQKNRALVAGASS
ncbi:MAG: hypothetical protein MUE60_15605 [Candidatus Eisenbacteria bacterium]|nr:hypothetical protein [Candidatus Eisenbacteria bacterium]